MKWKLWSVGILRNPNDGNGFSFMLLFFEWIILALFLFVMRPNSLRGGAADNSTKRCGPNDVCKFIGLGVNSSSGLTYNEFTTLFFKKADFNYIHVKLKIKKLIF